MYFCIRRTFAAMFGDCTSCLTGDIQAAGEALAKVLGEGNLLKMCAEFELQKLVEIGLLRPSIPTKASQTFLNLLTSDTPLYG